MSGDLERGLIIGQQTPQRSVDAGNTGERLQGEFTYRGVRVKLTLSPEGVTWQPTGTTKCLCGMCSVGEGQVALEDVLSIRAVSTLTRWKNCMLKPTKGLVVTTYAHHPKKYQELLQHELTFKTDTEEVEKWANNADKMLGAMQHRPKRLMIIINPYGGKRRARMLWQLIAEPVFALTGVQCDVRETERAQHAEDMVKELTNEQLASLDGIIAVGGDGLFHEVVNGILAARAMRDGTPEADMVRQLRLGHIPAGSTDTVSYTLHGTRSVLTAVMRIALGDRNPLDVARVDLLQSLTHTFAVSMIAYGYMGDLIKESETLRKLGPLRYEYVGAKVLFKSATYKAKVSYLAANAVDLNDATPDHAMHRAKGMCVANCMHCSYVAQSTGMCFGAGTDDPIKFTRAAKRVSLLEGPERVGWDVIEGEFRSIMVVIIPCRSNKSTKGVIQDSHLADGRMHLVLVNKCSNTQYLRFLLGINATGLTDGMFDFVTIKTVKAVQVRPIEKESYWNCDGELLPENHISIRAHQGLVQVFSRGLDPQQLQGVGGRPLGPPVTNWPVGDGVEGANLASNAEVELQQLARSIRSVAAPHHVVKRKVLPGAFTTSSEGTA